MHVEKLGCFRAAVELVKESAGMHAQELACFRTLAAREGGALPGRKARAEAALDAQLAREAAAQARYKALTADLADARKAFEAHVLAT